MKKWKKKNKRIVIFFTIHTVLLVTFIILTLHAVKNHDKNVIFDYKFCGACLEKDDMREMVFGDYCTECGSKVSEVALVERQGRICVNCGHKCELSDDYCANCGWEVSEVKYMPFKEAVEKFTVEYWENKLIWTYTILDAIIGILYIIFMGRYMKCLERVLESRKR